MSDINLQEAAEALRKAEKENIDHCGDEIEAVLAKYGCMIIPQVIIRGGEIIPQMLIVPKKDGQGNVRMNSNG